MILAVSLIACILISLLIAVVTGYFIRSASLKKWEELPRKRGAGAGLGLLALLFFIPNVEPMFSAKENLTVLVIAAIVLTVLCYLYLDYLFSRAFAGALILVAHFMLNASYAADLKFSSFFAFMCFVVGTIGIFISAKPHWMRDWIRKIAASTKWRIVSTAVPLLFAIASLILVIQLKGVL